MKAFCLLVMCVLCTGCSWLVPTEVKRQVNIMSVDINTCIKEMNEAQTDKDARDKAVRTLTRLKSNVQTVNDYMQGKQANRTKVTAEELFGKTSSVTPNPANVPPLPEGTFSAKTVPAAVEKKEVKKAEEDKPQQQTIFDALNNMKIE